MIADALSPIRQNLELAGTFERSQADADAIYNVQQRARDVLEMNRKMVPIPGPESVLDYRKRVVELLKPNTSLATQYVKHQRGDEFAHSEAKILKEAAANYLRPRDVPAGELVKVVRHDRAGREITEFATGQKGVKDPVRQPAQAFKSVYGAYMSPALVSPICLDGQPLNKNYRG